MLDIAPALTDAELAVDALAPQANHHQRHLLAALQLARRALTLSNPNPRVGCRIVAADGRIVGEGYTQHAGGAHAEVMALRDAAARGQDVRGATAYVTLEPCAHTGRTGPCCVALAQAGIAQVHTITLDPNPLVAGRGFAHLRGAGVQLHVCDAAANPVDAALIASARALNVGFFSRMERARPWVRLKMAASIDGGTALGNGASQWITSEAARADGHAWRARACAILTGSGTIVADDPALNVRHVSLPPMRTTPVRIAIVDSQLRTPMGARVLRNALNTAAPMPPSDASAVRIYTSDASSHTPQAQALRHAGAQIVPVEMAKDGNQLDLHAICAHLAQTGHNELHVEAGAGLAGALLKAGLVDEILLYQAPVLLGCGTRGLTTMGPLVDLSQALRLHCVDHQKIGTDWRLLLRPEGPMA